MTQPTVSICIPAYARPAELRAAIESVVSQDFEDLEVVVRDDSGGLEPVVREVADARVRYFRNPVTLGMARNWNAVLDQARGTFVSLLMDDDRLLPGFVTSVLSVFQRDPTVQLVFTNHFFDDGTRLQERRCGLPEGRYGEFLPSYLEYMPVAVSAAMMRSDVWQQVRPLPDLKTADIVLHVRAALGGAVFYYLDRPLMIYGVHPGQLSAQEQFREDVVDAWELFEFENVRCEQLRRRLLATALTSRAAAHLKRGWPDHARADISRAAELDRRALGLRGWVVQYLAKHPSLVPTAMRVLQRAGLVSRPEHSSPHAGGSR